MAPGRRSPSTPRQSELHRHAHRDQRRLALIALARTADFSLDEIALMSASDGQPRLDRQMLRTKAEERDKAIRRPGTLRNGLLEQSKSPAAKYPTQDQAFVVCFIQNSTVRERNDSNAIPSPPTRSFR